MAMLARKLRSLRPEQVVEVDVDRGDDVDGVDRFDGGDVVLVDEGWEDVAEDRLSRRWCLGLLLAWAFIFSTSVAIEPPPAHPNAPEPLAAVLLSTVLLGAWAVMTVGLLARHPGGAKASFVAGGLFLAAAIACPVTGHHSSIGLWWFYELAGAATLMALSLLALPRRAGDRVRSRLC